MRKAQARGRKVDGLVQEALADILATQLTDPRLDMITITGVKTSPDSRYADVFVTAHGDEQRYAEMLDGLKAASGRMRTLLGRRIHTRNTPELRFHLDESIDEGMRISAAIIRTNDRTDDEGHLPPTPLADEDELA